MRIALALAVCAVSVLGWTAVVTALGNHPPHPVIAGLFVLTLLGAPASMVAFAVARDYNSPRIIGTASGVVNVGGFLASAGVVRAASAGWSPRSGGSSPAHLRFALLVPVRCRRRAPRGSSPGSRRERAILRARQRAGRRCRWGWPAGSGGTCPSPPLRAALTLHWRLRD